MFLGQDSHLTARAVYEGISDNPAQHATPMDELKEEASRRVNTELIGEMGFALQRPRGGRGTLPSEATACLMELFLEGAHDASDKKTPAEAVDVLKSRFDDPINWLTERQVQWIPNIMTVTL